MSDAAFFAPMDDTSTQPSAGEEPILLGPPSEAPVNPSTEYIGEIDAAPPAVAMDEPMVLPPTDAPLVMPPAPEETPFMVPVEEAEPAPVTGGATGDELSPMAVWNNEWQVTLKERKDLEASAKATAVQKAEEDLATFQAQRESKRESKMTKNREEEQEKLEAIEAGLESENSWQRVVKMVELNQDAGEEALDCGRMRDVLIFLKNDNDRAAILA